MKFILLTIFIALISLVPTLAERSSPVKPRFSKYAIVHQLFEMMRDLIRRGSEEKGVPVMDPYDSDLEVSFSEKNFRLNANITKARISGLSDFYVSKADFDEEKISIDTKIIFPQIKVYSDSYEMEGDIWKVIPLEGRGIFNVEVHYLTVFGKIYLKPSDDGKSILIDRVENPKFYIEKIISTTQYDENFDDIFNSMIGDLLAGYLNRFNGYLTTLHTQASIDLLNPVLDKFDTWQILATILENVFV